MTLWMTLLDAKNKLFWCLLWRTRLARYCFDTQIFFTKLWFSIFSSNPPSSPAKRSTLLTISWLEGWLVAGACFEGPGEQEIVSKHKLHFLQDFDFQFFLPIPHLLLQKDPLCWQCLDLKGDWLLVLASKDRASKKLFRNTNFVLQDFDFQFFLQFPIFSCNI